MSTYCKVSNKYEITLPSELSVLGIDTDNVVIPLDVDPTSGFYRNVWYLTREQTLENLELIMKWIKVDQTKIPISVSLSVDSRVVNFSVCRNSDETQLEWKDVCANRRSPEFDDPITVETSAYDVRKLLKDDVFTFPGTTWEFEIFFLPEIWQDIQHKQTLAKWAAEKEKEAETEALIAEEVARQVAISAAEQEADYDN